MQDIYQRQARLLLHILNCLEYETTDSKPFFALKGGTALNFFIQPFPRYSVDLDLTYCPLDEREASLAAMRQGLQRLGQTLHSRLAGVVCTHTQSPAGDKMLVHHHGVTVKVEPNGIIRGTVFPTEIRPLCQEAQSAFNTTANVRCLSEADLYGGKICAAMDRQHPRDLFDILPLMRSGGLDVSIRKAFLVYALSHPRPLAELIDPHPQPLKHIFRTEFAGMVRDTVDIETLEKARAWIIQTIQSALTRDERRFLLSCKAGDPDWSLAELPGHVPQLPAIRWKLHNISLLRQKHPKKHAEALSKLENCLFPRIQDKQSLEMK
jgi:predicted nucleotidyltransferase component of viral defense system